MPLTLRAVPRSGENFALPFLLLPGDTATSGEAATTENSGGPGECRRTSPLPAYDWSSSNLYAGVCNATLSSSILHALLGTRLREYLTVSVRVIAPGCMRMRIRDQIYHTSVTMGDIVGIAVIVGLLGRGCGVRKAELAGATLCCLGVSAT